MTTSSSRHRFSLLILTLLMVQTLAARRIGVLLPFSAQGSVRQTMVEFYRGFLMAADSARTLGLSQEIYAIDCGTTAQEMEEVLSRGQMAQMDCIVGPGVAAQADALAAFCARNGIQLFMPFNTPVSSQNGSPLVFQNIADQHQVDASAVALLVQTFRDANFVLVYTNEKNARGDAFQSTLRQRLETLGLPFKVLNVNADDMATEEAMAISRRNIVVPDSNTETALQLTSALMSKFLKANPSYKASLVGYPEWLGMTSRHSQQLYALDTYVFSTYYNNSLSGRSVHFNQRYNSHFRQPAPTRSPSMAMMGFDVGVFVMQASGLQPLQQGFSFLQAGNKSPYVNRFVELVHFGSNHMIEQVGTR